MPDVVMPRLSDSMEEGTILKWLKADGDEVAKGEELVEIETDKATMTYEADVDGPLQIVAQEGDTLPIGATIASVGGGSAPAETASAAPAEAADSAEAEAKGDSGDAGAGTTATATESAPAQDDGADDEAPGDKGNGGRAKASPVARRIARERGIDLASISGTGPNGRIVKSDVEAAAKATANGGTVETPVAERATEPAPAAEAPAPAPSTPAAAAPAEHPGTVAETGTAKGDVTVQEISRIQTLIARRMAESKATVPEFTLTVDVDMEGCVALRKQLKSIAESGGGPVPSFNDMIVKASGIALRDNPRANGSYKDGHFELYSRVNVGVAVAAHDTLVVPTVFDADKKSLGEIARDTRGLADRVRQGTITPPELAGGTFTVSNLGMFGVTSFTAVINTPQAAILAVGRMEPRPVVRDGEIVARNILSLTLASDHRILYGADAAEFLGRIKELLEQPIALAL